MELFHSHRLYGVALSFVSVFGIYGASNRDCCSKMKEVILNPLSEIRAQSSSRLFFGVVLWNIWMEREDEVFRGVERS